ncbi:MAG: bifunctional oligoribonuclease/PAP phosphatase NrnA [Anaerolineales bacterium]|nr:bifunctional oligoribonuclease/PAP phosphatase NrnA [Anaerolineales bacterium]MCB8951032.1 bifunctional oligoribonuclease/PAP phosphatase NrnA [Ardenticatenales bacterium]
MPPETTTAVLDTLRPAQNILIITHIAPDGDAIGSLTGMGLILRQMGKNVTLACDDPVPDHLRFLPDVDAVRQPQIEGAFDLIVAVDCGDEERMGQSLTLLGNPRPPILNIDHHITNTCFGVTNLVDGTTTSTAEILFNLLPVLGVSLTPDIARSLLTGIVTDTLGFRIAGVTAQTISAASVLMEAGADLTMITMQALNLKPLSTLRMYQKGLANMQLRDGLLWTCVSYAEQQEVGYDQASSAGLVSMLGNTSEAAFGVVLMEMADGRVSVGFRCRPPWSVSELATSLGGGGHALASGCTISGPLAAAEQLIVSRGLAEIKRQVARAAAAG